MATRTVQSGLQVKLPNAQGWTADINAAVDSYIEKYFPNWNKVGSQICIPTLSRCDWEAPVGQVPGAISATKGVDPAQAAQADKEHIVTAHLTETATKNAIAAYLSTLDHQALLISNMILSRHLVRLMSTYLAVDLDTANIKKKLKKKKKNVKKQPAAVDSNWSSELTDVLVVHSQIGVLLVEVKASLTDVKGGQAYTELQEAKNWLTNEVLTKGFPGTDVPIQKVISLPYNEMTDFDQAGLRPHKDCLFLTKSDMSSLENLNTWFQVNHVVHDDPVLSSDDSERLRRCLFMTKIAVFQELSKQEHKPSKILVRQEYIDTHLAQRQVLDTITSAKFLLKSHETQSKLLNPNKLPKNNAGNPQPEQLQPEAGRPDEEQEELEKEQKLIAAVDLEPLNIKELKEPRKPHLEDALFNEVLFLNPEQLAIWDSPYQYQFISGYASTGKTVLLQNMALKLVRNDEKVLIVVPDCVNSFYAEYMKRNLANYHQLIDDKKLIIGNVKVLNKMDLESLEEFSIFFDEMNVLNQNCTQEELSTVVGLVEKSLSNAARTTIIWAAFDDLQCLAQGKIEQADQVSTGTSQINLPMTLSSIVRQHPYGCHKKLTTALRCTIEVYKEWEKIVDVKLLRAGHSVSVPELKPAVLMAKVDLAKAVGGSDEDKKFNVLSELVYHGVTGALQDGWQPFEVAVVFNSVFMSLEPFAGKLNEKISQNQAQFQIAPAAQRFPGTVNSGSNSCVTVDLPINIVSHEWPVIIEVDDPRCFFIPNFAKYVTKSRCLLQLITVRIAHPSLDPNKPISRDQILTHGQFYDVMSMFGDMASHVAVSMNEMEEYINVVMWRDFNDLVWKLVLKDSKTSVMSKWILSTVKQEDLNAMLQSILKNFEHMAIDVIEGLNTFHITCQTACLIVKQKNLIEEYRLTAVKYICMEYRRVMKTWHRVSSAVKSAGFPINDDVLMGLNIPHGLMIVGCSEYDETYWKQAFAKIFRWPEILPENQPAKT